MKHICILLALCAAWACMLGCEEENSSSSSSSSGSSGTTAQQGTGTTGGQTATTGGQTTPAGGGTGGGTGTDTHTGASPRAGDFAVSGVAQQDIAEGFFPEAEGRPVVRYHVTPGNPGERDITFLGKFPSTNAAEFKVHVEVDGQAQMNRDLRVVSVANDKIVIHFPPASDMGGQAGLFGMMTVTVEWSGHKTSINIYIP